MGGDDLVEEGRARRGVEKRGREGDDEAFGGRDGAGGGVEGEERNVYEVVFGCWSCYEMMQVSFEREER